MPPPGVSTASSTERETSKTALQEYEGVEGMGGWLANRSPTMNRECSSGYTSADENSSFAEGDRTLTSSASSLGLRDVYRFVVAQSLYLS